MKAMLSNFKQSPRKVRLVADMIRGKSVVYAAEQLAFLPKKSAPEIAKLLASAVANAREKGVSAENLVVKTISVDKGLVLRRFSPKARGRAGRINRTMSIVRIELGMKGEGAKKKTQAAPKVEAPEASETNTEKPAAKKRAAKKKTA